MSTSRNDWPLPDGPIEEWSGLVVNSPADVPLEQPLNLVKAIARAEGKLQLNTGVLSTQESRANAVQMSAYRFQK